MTKHKIQNKLKSIQIPNVKTSVLIFVILILNLFCALNFDICHLSFAQEGDLEFNLDVTLNTIPLPKIFKPNIDLSGRGFYHQRSWPQELAALEVLDLWQKDIGFNGVYRLQYNLWEIDQLAKEKDLQDKLLANYETIIKNISDAGGVVILDIFGTPAGLGKVLDKKSSPWNLKAFKELIKSHIRELSCNKRYNIWYEVWSAPDLDSFFLGRKQEYLNLYKAVAESIKELEAETKIHILLGGPAVSWWFQDIDGNTIVSPERGLIYELIKFCSRYKLPLDFISWHAYSTDPKAEKEATIYNKTAIALIRDWLSYFNFARDTPLIVDEWNYDRELNVLQERYEKSFICASYIPSRIKNMYEAGLDYQLYFCLEDFQNNKEGINRNVGVFWFDPEASEYKGSPKSIYNVFRMLTKLRNNMFLSPLKLEDEFVGIIATKGQEDFTLLIYNYIDPEIFRNYLSRNISTLNNAERKALLDLIKSKELEKIMRKELDVSSLRLSNKVKAVLNKAQELNERATKFRSSARNIKIGIKNLQRQNYLYQRYTIDSSCSLNCEFIPCEEKQVSASDLYQEVLTLSPYSVNMILLKKKPKEPEKAPEVTLEQPPVEQPPVEQPPVEQPPVEQPVQEKPVESLPAAQNLKEEKPLPEKPKEEQPAVEKLPPEKTETKKLDTQKSTPEQPIEQ